MSLDAEELKRRRQERTRRRKAANRRLWLRIGIAALILALVIGSIFLVSYLSRVFRESKPQPTEPPATVIHLAAAGDLTVTDRVVASGGDGFNYTKAFLDVAHLFGSADISVLNFEGNLVGSPYGSAYMSAPDSMMQALDKSGVDLIQLANSYSIKNGMSGLTDTIDAVRAAGMEPLGVYSDNNSFRKSGGYTICTVEGIRIAFVAFTKGMDGMTLPTGNEDCVNLLYTDYDSAYQTVNTQKISAVFDAIAKEKPDLTVALVHWGSEFNDTVSPTQEKICNLMLEKGADAIIGTHPHYLQQMIFNEAAGTFIAYSLGDFFGDGQRSGSEYSVVLDLEITKTYDGVTKITGFSYTPIFTVSDEADLRVVRIHETMHAYDSKYISRISEATYKSMEYALDRIEARINGE